MRGRGQIVQQRAIWTDRSISNGDIGLWLTICDGFKRCKHHDVDEFDKLC